MSYQPKTGEKCFCRSGIERDNCQACEGTGLKVDFKKIRDTETPNEMIQHLESVLQGRCTPAFANNEVPHILRAVKSHEALLEAAKDALCELDPDCKYDGSNYSGEPTEKGNPRIQTILMLYRIIAQAEGKGE